MITSPVMMRDYKIYEYIHTYESADRRFVAQDETELTGDWSKQEETVRIVAPTKELADAVIGNRFKNSTRNSTISAPKELEINDFILVFGG